MIFSPHIIIGAAIGAKTQNLGLIIILGLLSHFIMDKLPHWDYSVIPDIKNFRQTKSIKLLIPLILKSTIDVIFGLLIVLLLVWQKDIFDYLFFIIAGIFFSLLPDAVGALIFIFGNNNLFNKFSILLRRFFHYPRNKEKEGEITFLGLFTQIVLILIAISSFFF